MSRRFVVFMESKEDGKIYGYDADNHRWVIVTECVIDPYQVPKDILITAINELLV